jgi:hypothetical protein
LVCSGTQSAVKSLIYTTLEALMDCFHIGNKVFRINTKIVPLFLLQNVFIYL